MTWRSPARIRLERFVRRNVAHITCNAEAIKQHLISTEDVAAKGSRSSTTEFELSDGVGRTIKPSRMRGVRSRRLQAPLLWPVWPISAPSNSTTSFSERLRKRMSVAATSFWFSWAAAPRRPDTSADRRIGSGRGMSHRAELQQPRRSAVGLQYRGSGFAARRLFECSAGGDGPRITSCSNRCRR